MKKMDNKGFTLIEMLISVMITGLMMLGVSAFISSSRVSYSRVTTSVSLQEEAGITTKFLNEIIVESSEWGQFDGLSYTDAGTGMTSQMFITWFVALDDSKEDLSDRSECYYFIIWEKDTQCIRYAKFPVSEINKVSLVGEHADEYLTGLLSDHFFDDYSMISRYATTFSVLPDPENMRRFHINLIFTYNGENYEAHVNSVSRNE